MPKCSECSYEGEDITPQKPFCSTCITVRTTKIIEAMIDVFSKQPEVMVKCVALLLMKNGIFPKEIADVINANVPEIKSPVNL